MEMKKRDRSANFSIEENRMLVDLILKYKDIIENKRTDAVTWKQKDAGWTRLTAEFNCQLSKNRTTKMLKIKYEGLKRALKKKKQTNARELFQTAGGTPVIIPYTDYEEKLLSILLLSVTGLLPGSDSDANLADPLNKNFTEGDIQYFSIVTDEEQRDEEDISMTTHTEIVESPTMPAIVNTAKGAVDLPIPGPNNGSEMEWSMWTPGNLRTPTSGKLKTHARKAEKQNINDKFSLIADQRGLILETQKLLAERELEIKEEELKLKNKELEIKVRELEILNAANERDEERHALKMSILKLEYENKKKGI